MNVVANKNLSDLPHILVIDDDERIRELVSRYLMAHDFVAMAACDAARARLVMERFAFDALVVDVMMPGETGLAFVKSLREKGRDIPVLLLTALGEAEDRIAGLESGADDYLPKPFEPRELVLRLQAILRRRVASSTILAPCKIGRWIYDPALNELQDADGGEILRLTTAEGNLLSALVQQAGAVVTRDELAERLGLDTNERSIDVQVTRLRRKLEEDPKAPRYLQTVRGKGYLLRVEEI